MEIGDGDEHRIRPQDERRASQQRRENLLRGDVEAERRKLQDAIVGPQTVAPGHLDAVVDQGAMRNENALGPAGRAGREHDVRQVVGAGGRRLLRPSASAVVRRASLPRLVLEADDTHLAGRQARQEPPLRQQNAHARLLQDAPDMLARIARIERHVRGTGLQDPQEAGHHLDRALGAQGDHRFRSDSQPTQAPGQDRGAAIQGGIRDPLVPEADRDRLRGARRRGLEQLVNAALAREISLRAAPFDQDLPALLLRKERQM